MNLDKVKEIVAGIAPTIATALGGPYAGTAVKFLADKFTGGDEAKVEDVILSGNPNTLLELKKAEIEFQKFTEELGIKRDQLTVEDRKSARDMAKHNMWPQIILSAVFIAGFFWVLHGFVYGGVTVEGTMKDVVLLLIGLIIRELPTIMQFWFGSSFGSKEKSNMINFMKGGPKND